MDEIEALFVTLGMKTDDASVSASVKEMIQKLQQNLNSSIYGGKNGVITLPATIEGTYKNGKEIEKEIKDAYAAIYEKAKQMADKSVSLTLNDVKDFKSQIDKFGKLTSKKRGNDIIANANNNLRQTLSSYQDFIGDLQKQVNVKQKQIKKQNKSVAKENAKNHIDTKVEKTTKNDQKRRLKGIKSVLPKGYGVGWVDPSRTNIVEAKKSEKSFYASGMNRQFMQSQREARRTFEKESLISDKYATKAELNAEIKRRRETDKTEAKHHIQGRNQNKFSPQEKAFQLSEDIRKNILPNLLDKIQASDDNKLTEQLTQKLFDTLNTVSKLNQDAGKLIFNDVKKNIGLVMGKLGFTSQGLIGGTDGGDKTAVSRDPKMIAVVKGLLDKVAEKEDAIKQELIRLEQLAKDNTKTKTEKTINSFANRLISETQMSKIAQTQKSNEIVTAVSKDMKATEKQMTNDNVENAAERVADSVQEKEQKETTTANIQEKEVIEEDASTGFNTSTKSEELIQAQSDLKRILGSEVKGVLEQILSAFSTKASAKDMSLTSGIKTNLEGIMCPCQDILSQIAQGIQNIAVNMGNILQGLLSLGAKLPNNLPALVKGEGSKDAPIQKDIIEKNDYQKFASERQSREVEREIAEAIVKGTTEKIKTSREEKQKMYEDLFGPGGVNDLYGPGKTGRNNVTQSKVTMSPFQYIDSRFINTIRKAMGVDETRRNAQEISKMTQQEQEKLQSQRIAKFGLSQGGRDTDTGDLGRIFRTRSLFGWGKNVKNPFENLNLSDGINIDTTAITEALQNAIQKNMFTAQTGGVWRNLIGPMTFYAGQPSLEKSRAEAEAANQIMANIRNTVQTILNDILAKETALKGMADSGKAVFENGKLVQDNTEGGAATKLFGDLENQKVALQGVLADAGMVNETVKECNGNLGAILKKLGFVAPELRKNNTIIQNINAGLDKNGKALKFQTRRAEVLNYTFQLMARSVGQMIKRWVALVNPINLIKRAFRDFMSFDVKWQRTMNVIKYNLRRIIMPAMQWIAQQIVNVIGLVNALIKGIGSVFGQNWDLFDQSAASAEQMREELEQAANVTASFDELHDIGTSSSGNPAMDLMGDIYTPQWTGLYEILENVGKGIGEVFKFVGKVIEDIQKATEGWTFWDWLLLAGAAVAGFLALKWLIGIFKGKNPLQSVADGLNFLEKAVGWAILIWSVTEFTKALKDFVDCMKTADWDDIAKSLSLFGGALSELGIVLLVLMVVAKIVGTTFLDSLGIAAMIAAFSLFVFVLTNFAETMKSLTEDDVINALALLGGALLEITLVLITLSAVFTALVGTGYGTLAIILLGVILVIVGLIVVALTEFVKALKDAGDDVKLALEGCAELFQTIGEQIVASILATGMAISMIIATIINGIIGIINSVVNGIAKIIQTIGNVIMGIIDTIGRSIERIVISVGKSISLIISTVAKSIIGIIDSLAKAFETVGNTICKTVETIASAIDKIVTSIANGITTVLTPILTFVDKVISKLVELASTVVKEIGQTIRSIIETVGNVIIRIIQEVLNAVPRLLNSILSFCWNIGPAIENSASAIMRTITRIVNFIISAVEYLVNTVIWGLNNMARAANNVSQLVGIKFGLMTYVSIPRFIPQYETGTNYVPNDGLAYLHQGEAVIPKKYNTPYQPDDSRTEDAIDRLAQVVAQIEAKVDQGIPVKGEFIQRGSDLVAVVDRVNNKISNNILNNRVYAR